MAVRVRSGARRSPAAARRHAAALPDWDAAVQTFEEHLLALAPEDVGLRRVGAEVPPRPAPIGDDAR